MTLHLVQIALFYMYMSSCCDNRRRLSISAICRNNGMYLPNLLEVGSRQNPGLAYFRRRACLSLILYGEGVLLERVPSPVLWGQTERQGARPAVEGSHRLPTDHACLLARLFHQTLGGLVPQTCHRLRGRETVAVVRRGSSRTARDLCARSPADSAAASVAARSDLDLAQVALAAASPEEDSTATAATRSWRILIAPCTHPYASQGSTSVQS